MINFFNAFRGEKRSRPIANYQPYFFQQDGKILEPRTIRADMAVLNSDIFAILFRISSDISAIKLNTGIQPVQLALDKPQSFFNAYNFRQQILAQLMLNGNSYVYIHRNAGGVISGLELIPFSNVQIEINDDSSDLIYHVDWSFTDDKRGNQNYSSKDILHFRLFTPATIAPYIGLSPLVSLAKEVEIQNQSNRLTIGTLKNAISPTYTLTVPQGILEADAKTNIREQFVKANQEAGKPIVLDQGLLLNKIDINPDVAKFLANTTFTQTQIAKAFCVPDDYLNGKGNEQSSIEQIRSLYQNSLSIYLAPIISEIELKLNCTIKADISAAMDIDNQQLINNIAKLAAGKTPVLGADEANLILNKRGVF